MLVFKAQSIHLGHYCQVDVLENVNEHLKIVLNRIFFQVIPNEQNLLTSDFPDFDFFNIFQRVDLFVCLRNSGCRWSLEVSAWPIESIAVTTIHKWTSAF